MLSQGSRLLRLAAPVARLAIGCAFACLSAVAARAAGAELSGRVLVDAGKPAPATTALELRRSEADLERAQRLAAGKADAPAPIVVGHPDASGRFTLAAPAGNWILSVRAPGFVAAAVEVLGFVDDVEIDDVVLRPETRLRVEVRGGAGGPVEGAWVSARNLDPAPRRGGPRPSPWRHLERTDARGAATVSCVKGERLEITVVGNGVAATSPAHCAGEAPLRVALPSDAARRVVVHGAQNEPLAGAVLVESGSYLPLARTARDGAATVAVPARGRDLAVLAPAHRFLRTIVPPPMPDGAPFALRLEPMPRVSGRVLEAGTRRPLAGALVWPWANPGSAVLTDARGEFTLDEDPARLLASAAGHGETILTDADSRAPVTLLLEPVSVVTGRVLDGGRRPIGEARIVARPGRSTRRMRMQSSEPIEARSRADGSFRLSGLSPEVAYEVLARRDGFAPATLALPPAAPGVPWPQLEIVLGSGNEVLLRVLDAAGKPVERARGELRASDPEELRPQRVLDLTGEGDAVAAESDGAGTVRWTHVNAGSYEVAVKARGFAPLTLPGIEVRAPSDRGAAPAAPSDRGARVDLGTVRLEPGVVLTGVAVDPSGTALGGITVWARSRNEMLFGAGFREPDATTASDGTFAIADLAPGGLMNVVASGEGRTSAQAEGVQVPTDTPLRLVLAPLSRVRGRVVDLDGRPVRGADLQWQATRRTFAAIFSRSSRPSGVSRDDGSFVLGDVPAGAMRLTASREGYLSGVSGELEVPAGRDLEGVELVLRPGAAVSGRVVDGDDAPVAGVSVSLQGDRDRWSSVSPVDTDGDGRYRLPEVPPGLRTLVAESAEGGRAALELEVKLGENTLDFRLAGGFELSGAVVDERDQPVGGARVALLEPETHASGRPREAVSAADGSFVLRGVRQGRFHLEAHAVGYSDASLGPLAVEGAMSGLTLRLSQGSGNIAGALRGLDLRELGSAEVMAVSSPGSWRRGIVDARGRYRVPGVAPGDWTVQATVDRGRRRAQGTAKVDEGATETTLDLDFSGGFSLSGRVTRNQQPLAGASVYAIATEARALGSGQTDADGRFRLDGLAAGKYIVGVRTYGAQLHQEVVELAEDRELTIALTTAAVRGRVVDAADKSPLAGARVELEPLEVGSGEMFLGGDSTVSDSSGAFLLDDAVAGHWRVTAALDGYAAGSTSVEVGEGGDASVDIALERSDGVALDLSRPGAQTVDVVALQANGEVVFAGSLISTDTGRVRLSTLPRGTYRVVLATGSDAVATVTATTPGPPISVALVPGGRIELTMPALLDEPRGGIVTLHSETQGDLRIPRWGNLLSSWPASHGKVELTGVPPGTWTINAVGTAPGQSWSTTVTVAPGATVAVELK